jgi:isoleucyl-tRNA synthetase
MRRVEDVLDCWFESGSMPFAAVHYPFENQEWFETHFPGDFIVEYLPQTRGWFYTLHVLATALFDRPAFRNCVVHGVLLDDEGQKLSKRSKNYTDPLESFERIGADAMRWFFMSSTILRGGDLVVTEKAISDSARRMLNPLWSAWHFFTLYANTDRYRATFRTDATGVLDRYILAKTGELVTAVGERMDAYDLPGACEVLERFVDGALNNWYIRRSRNRFWQSDTDAFDTLATVLENVLRVAAPLLPMVTDAAYRGLTGTRSVHLADWPAADDLPADAELVAAMDLVRDVCSAAHSIRKDQRRRARLPLPSLTIATADFERLRPYVGLIEDEVNVKHVELTAAVGHYAREVLQLNPAVLGPRLGPAMQQVFKAQKAGDWSVNRDGTAVVGGQALEPGEFTLVLKPTDGERSRPIPGTNGVVMLDLDVTPELEAEGLARDIVRLVQMTRREEDLDIADRIHLTVDAHGHDDVRAAIETHRDHIMGETLAVELAVADNLADGHRHELPDGRAIRMAVRPVTT